MIVDGEKTAYLTMYCIPLLKIHGSLHICGFLILSLKIIEYRQFKASSEEEEVHNIIYLP